MAGWCKYRKKQINRPNSAINNMNEHSNLQAFTHGLDTQAELSTRASTPFRQGTG